MVKYHFKIISVIYLENEKKSICIRLIKTIFILKTGYMIKQ